MGLPGVVPLYLGYPLYELCFGAGSFEQTNATLGDNTWPMFLVLTTVWPILLPLGWLVAGKFSQSPPLHKYKKPFFFGFLLLSLSVVGCLGLLLFSR